MNETRIDTRERQKVTTSHSPDNERHIREDECDGLPGRIREIIGDRKNSWFAKECGFGESLLRKYLAGAQPNTQNLVSMARVGDVTVDWLATGRLPKTRSELRRFLSTDSAKSTINDLPPLLAAKVGMAVGMSDILADIPPKSRQGYLVAAAELILDLSSGNPHLQEQLTEDPEILEAAIRIAKTIVAQRAMDALGTY